MSTSAPARTNKGSSQRPSTRAPPADSTKSESRRSGYGSGQIPLSAATSSTSFRQNETAEQVDDERRKSTVTFGRSVPSLAPSDSVSRVKSRSKPPSAGQSSGRRSSRATGTAWRSSKSHGSRASSSRGTAWSGSGAPLTETNLERLNEEDEQDRSQLDAVAKDNAEPRSDQQEGAQSSRRVSRQYTTAVETEQRTSGRSSRRNTVAQSNNLQTEGRSSRRFSAAATQNVSQRDADASGAKTASQSRSRKDSMSPEGTAAAYKGASDGPPSSKRSAGSGSQQRSGSNATSEQDASGGWERKVVVTTKRWPDGREVREREIKLVRSAPT